jgi:NAD(P)-dependent dehydrogenase (short-subunit alcohol dehydrogenase family)
LGFCTYLHLQFFNRLRLRAGHYKIPAQQQALFVVCNAQTNITINALAPAVIETALVRAMPQEQVTYMTDKIPMKRCGTLEEIANMATFIVSDENSFTTGFTFDLSGGRATY